jgi:hypothetical protein
VNRFVKQSSIGALFPINCTIINSRRGYIKRITKRRPITQYGNDLVFCCKRIDSVVIGDGRKEE